MTSRSVLAPQTLVTSVHTIALMGVLLGSIRDSRALPARACQGESAIPADVSLPHPLSNDLMERVRERYQVEVEVFFPDARQVEAMVRGHGPNLFYKSVEARLWCCHVRKVEPMRRALAGLEAWITGLRRDQSTTRATIHKIELDAEHGGLMKLNPLCDWTPEQVWDYIEAHDVPTHRLYQQGYTSIGCAPCTPPTLPGDAARAGRWWWERNAVKECGIHGLALTVGGRRSGQRPQEPSPESYL
jgi:phosphoadenylyl-sulfate reductase (thioredoxin)